MYLFPIYHISGNASVSLEGDQMQDVSLFECISEHPNQGLSFPKEFKNKQHGDIHRYGHSFAGIKTYLAQPSIG